MIRSSILTFVIAVVSLGFAFTTNAHDTPRSPFDRWDKNKDGKLTRDELPENLRKNFDRADRNADGIITRAEDAAFRAGRTKPEVASRNKPTHADVAYADTENPKQRLDIYLPEGVKDDARLPVVVFIHGGGWRNGDKASGRARLVPFLATGNYACVSIGYRLTGEAIWPSQLHDCKAAIRFLRANADKYHLDADRIGIWGTSAGGHLVAMLGVTGHNDALSGDLGSHDDVSSAVKCVANFYGPADLLTMGDFPSAIDHNAADSPESKLIGGAIQEHQEKTKAASPLTYASKTAAPMLLVHGDKDRLVPVDQSQRFAAALKEKGAVATLIEVTGGGHGGFRNREIDRRLQQFFDHHLLGEGEQPKGGKVPNNPS